MLTDEEGRRQARRTSLSDTTLDRRGYPRSPITYSAYRAGLPAQNKGRRFPPAPLTKPEMLRLLDACEHGLPSCAAPDGEDCPAAARNRALIVILWRSGLRLGEALALYPHDIDLDAGAVRILHGKGDRARTVGLDHHAQEIVEQWLAERPLLAISPADPLFCVIVGPSRGLQIHDSYVRELLHGLALKAGIYRRVTPHALRHTHAFELGAEGVPVHYIRRQLGHSSLAITARYMDHLAPLDVVERIRARKWPGIG